MTSWLIVIVGLLVSWSYIDLESSSNFQNAFLPIVFGLFLITAIVKFFGSIKHSRSRSEGSTGSGFWDSNDSGGGDSGCGGGD